MKFIIGTKQNMTQFFDETGEVSPATIVNAGPITVVYKRQKRWVRSRAIWFRREKESRISKPVKGHTKDLGNFKLLKSLELMPLI
ncbi:MAG: hypothetical protein R3B65_02205 [Candidatus Paceibacterota bacterium]